MRNIFYNFLHFMRNIFIIFNIFTFYEKHFIYHEELSMRIRNLLQFFTFYEKYFNIFTKKQIIYHNFIKYYKKTLIF